MKGLLLSLLMIIPSNDDNNNFQIIESDIYIYEYSIKKPGQAYVGFIVTNDSSIIQDICFTVFFPHKKIKKVVKKDKGTDFAYTFTKEEDGNIFVEGLRLLCYNSENFKKRDKRIPDDFYKMISDDFFSMTNKERLRILEELSK